MKDWQMEMLKKARRTKRLSQQAVANMADLYLREYQRVEMGERSIERISMKTGLSICAVLGIDPMDIVFEGKFVQGDPAVKKQDKIGMFTKATLDSIDREWEQYTYVPTNEPFDYSTTTVDGNALAEEVSRMTGIEVELAFVVLACEVCILEQTYIKEIWIKEMAKCITYLTRVEYDVVLRALEAEDEIYWKNGINFEGSEGNA